MLHKEELNKRYISLWDNLEDLKKLEKITVRLGENSSPLPLHLQERVPVFDAFLIPKNITLVLIKIIEQYYFFNKKHNYSSYNDLFRFHWELLYKYIVPKDQMALERKLLEEINTEISNTKTKFTFENGGKYLLEIIFSYPKENYISQLCNLKLKVGNEYKEFLNQIIFKTKLLNLAAEHNQNNEIKSMAEGGALEIIPAIKICIRNNNLYGVDILINSILMNKHLTILSDRDKIELIQSFLEIACEHAGLSMVDYIFCFSKRFLPQQSVDTKNLTKFSRLEMSGTVLNARCSSSKELELNFKQLIAKAAAGFTSSENSVSQANLPFLLSSSIQETKKCPQECISCRNNVTVISELLVSDLTSAEFKMKINEYEFHPEEIITARIRYRSDFAKDPGAERLDPLAKLATSSRREGVDFVPTARTEFALCRNEAANSPLGRVEEVPREDKLKILNNIVQETEYEKSTLTRPRDRH